LPRSFALPFVLLALSASCGSSGGGDASESTVIDTLTTAQLVGQRIIYSYPALTPPAALLDRIRAGQAAGVIFFGENISSPSQIQGVIQQLVAAQQESPVTAP